MIAGFVTPVCLAIFPLTAAALAYVLSHLVGSLTPTIALASLVLGLFWARRWSRVLAPANDLTWSWRGDETTPPLIRALEWALVILIALVAVRHFLWLFYPLQQKWWTLHANNLGDLPLHLQYIKSLALGQPTPWHSPSFSLELFRYALGADLFNALWECLAVPTTSHLALTGLVATAVSLVALRAWGSWLAIVAFFLSGGLLLWPGIGLTDSNSVSWKNLFLSVFLTQRGLMLALPIGVLILERFHAMLTGRIEWTRGRLRVLGWLLGLMPLMHLHSFVVLAVLLAGLWLIHGKGFARLLRGPLVTRSLVPGLWFIWHSTAGLTKASVVRWQPHWEAQQGQVFWYYTVNFGPWLILAIALTALLVWRRVQRPDQDSIRQLKEWAFFLCLFLVFLNVMLAPWAWDNIKCLIWPYLAMAALAARSLRTQRWAEQSVWLLAAVLGFSGLQSLLLSVQQPPTRGQALISEVDWGHARRVLQAVPDHDKPRVRFLTAMTHDHPLQFEGVLRVAGFRGHLWSHAARDHARIEGLVDGFFRGTGDWTQQLAELQADYVYLGPPERQEYQNVDFARVEWVGALELVAESGAHRLYRVRRKK
jgi:hypothetical protein